MLTELGEVLSRGEPFSGETINYRKDGSEYYVECDITPIRAAVAKSFHSTSEMSPRSWLRTSSRDAPPGRKSCNDLVRSQ